MSKRTASLLLKISCILLALCFVLSITALIRSFAVYGDEKEAFTQKYGKFLSEDRTALSIEEGENIFYIDVKNYGVIAIELYPEEAPITVANFKKLVSEKFYDGSTFHRVVENFVIQGGAPLGNLMDNSAEEIKGEFSANGIANNIKHERGILSMARLGNNYNSASSQFFIVHKTSANNSASLDGKYAAFGKVVAGMDVVDKIADLPTDYSEKPLYTVEMRTVTADKDSLATKEEVMAQEPVLSDGFASPFFVISVCATGFFLVATVVSVLLHSQVKRRAALAAAQAAEAERQARKAAQAAKRKNK